MYFLVYLVIGYRRKVVRGNLNLAFPEKSATQKKEIEKEFYSRLCQLMGEVLISPFMGRDFLESKVSLKDSEGGRQVTSKESSGSVLLTGHFFNWEWAGLRIGLMSDKPFNVVYQPVKNESLDVFFQNLRGQFGNHPVKMRRIFRVMKEESANNPVACFLADQSPKKSDALFYHDFFGRKTPFHNAPIKIARKFDYPLTFGYQEFINPGVYKVHIEVLAQNPGEWSEEELLESYVRRLEKVIREDPANWLWSHRRWKHAAK